MPRGLSDGYSHFKINIVEKELDVLYVIIGSVTY